MSDILLGDSDYNEKFDVLEGERLFKFVDETTEGQSNISDARYGNHVVKESNHGLVIKYRKYQNSHYSYGYNRTFVFHML